MQGLKGLTNNIASGFDVLYNNTLLWLKVLQILPQDDHSLLNMLQPTFPYTVGALLVMILLFIYYYIWLPVNWIKDYSDVGYHHIKASTNGKTKKELVEEVRRRRLLGDLPPVYPNGWFALLESTDLKAGQVKHVQALGENFAVMRTNKGKVHVLDAYCPHLGANLAVGGVVRGDCLECPFHGWQFRGEDGTCSHIPYSDKVPKTAVVKKWTSNEVNGLVFVWYHAEGEPPSWQIQNIPEIATGKLWYRGRYEILVNSHVQEFHENVADVAHFEYTHRIKVFDSSDVNFFDRLVHSVLKYSWTVDWKLCSGPGEAHLSSCTLNLCVRLLNKFKISPFTVVLNQTGPGCTAVWSNGFLSIVTFTPVEPLMTRVVLREYSPPSLFVFGGFYLYCQKIMMDRDVVMWNNKRYVKKPVFVKEDESIQKHRRWYSQFYSEHSPKFSFQRESLEW